jgi:predicted alpha-1,2-mannosidase
MRKSARAANGAGGGALRARAPGVRVRRWTVLAAILMAAGLVCGGPAALTAAAAAGSGTLPTAGPGPARQYGASTVVGTCGVTASGGLTKCPGPLPRAELPSGARDQAQVSKPVPAADLARLVDTRTWSSGGGNTFPGADVPFGMVQWSPDTLPDRSDGGGYGYTDTTLDGYSLTHLSGPGCGAAGDVPVLPMTGALPGGNPNDVTTPFSHAGEVAQAGYYSAQSNAPEVITSQFTATPHSSMGRFTFPQTTAADFLIKLQDSQSGDSADSAQVAGDNEVMGSDTSGNFCGRGNQYTVYFDITFSQPFTASQVVTEPGQTDPAAVFLTFDTTSDPVISAKVGISYVSTANARANWQAENPGWDFDTVKARAQRDWDRLLGKIRVSGGSYAQTQEFYSLLYKDFLQPNITSDVNGQYLGADGKVHTLAAGQQNQYGIFSGWDIYHSLAQLQAILDPGAASDMAQSLVSYYSQGGDLQRWGYLNQDSYVMVGDPADAFIADYYAFGARGFNTKQALADMLAQATTVNDVRPGEALEQEYGYLPADGSYQCAICNKTARGWASELLEYDTADFALSHFAAALGDAKDAAVMEQQANNWENIFDPANDLLTPRDSSGQFVPGITPTNTAKYVEGSAYEYLWDVPNDYPALFSLLGGDAKVVPELQQYLSQPNGEGMYAELTNEFDLGEQNALDYAGDPAGTQQAVNTVRNTTFLPGPDGLANNDDLGAESSQFIWEMLGLYPENPGSDTLLLDSPGFPQESISLPDGKTITINAPGASPADYYVKSLTINGKPDSKLYTPYSALSRGATLDWTLSTTPTTWGSAPQDAPPAYPQGLKPVIGYLPSQQVTVAPGASTTVTIAADNATGRTQPVRVSVSAPSGITATPASGVIHVPPAGAGTLTVTVNASAGEADGEYPVQVSFAANGKTFQSETLSVDVSASGA